jgi:hypothetical protein
MAHSASFAGVWLLIPFAILSTSLTAPAIGTASVSAPTTVNGLKKMIWLFSVHSNGQKLEIVQGAPVNEFSRGKIDTIVNVN